jgi:hypothetical protein
MAVIVFTGCDPAAGPTSGIDNETQLKATTGVSESAFGKKPQPTPVTLDGVVNLVGDFIAGQHTVVGQVFVEQNGDILTVSIETTGGWCMTETHVYVGEEPPAKSAPGQFPYGDDGLSCVDNWETPGIDVSEFDGTIYLAVHGVVEGDETGTTIQSSWAGYVQVTAKRGNGWAMNSYFDVSVADWGGLSGTYEGWCVDVDRHLSFKETYSALAFSTYDLPFPAGIIAHPENLDLINYLLNQDFVGQESPGGFGPYTFSDVQRVIWGLLDTHNSESGLKEWDQNRVDEILADVLANGEGFVPQCGQVYGVVLVPVDPANDNEIVGQPVLIPLPVNCGEGEETAWGQGYVGGTIDGMFQFGTGWGWYFPFELVD